MLKQIDKLIIKSFIGPLLLTTAIAVFIFLMRFLMLYFDDFVGKDLGIDVLIRLFFYFSLITVPVALPLAVLLSSLITFGNLGEYFELTALKSVGISLSRVLLPTLIFALGISLFSFWFNDKVAPWANLKGYSLLYDIKETKLTLNIKPGVFYREIPGFSIKVAKKMEDGKTIKGVALYDHSKQMGNVKLILADSGKMYTINNAAYLVFELFNGTNYEEMRDANTTNANKPFLRNKFKSMKVVMSLDAFGIKRTDESRFTYHEYMKNLVQLGAKSDSIQKDVEQTRKTTIQTTSGLFSFHAKNNVNSNPSKPDFKQILGGAWVDAKMAKQKDGQLLYENTYANVKGVLSTIETTQAIVENRLHDLYRTDLEWHHKFTQAIICFVMFLIGASLGAIIKKGGFGMPVVLSISFFILYYVLIQLGDKNAKQGILSVPVGAWLPIAVLFIIGLYFLKIARNDSRLFDKDVYQMAFEKLRNRWRKG